MDAARAKGVKIFHAPISFSDSYSEVNGNYGILANVKGGECFKGSGWGAEFNEVMMPAEGDIVVGGKRGLWCVCGDIPSQTHTHFNTFLSHTTHTTSFLSFTRPKFTFSSHFCLKSSTPQPHSGFASTNLDFMLRQNKIETVVLAGFLTNW